MWGYCVFLCNFILSHIDEDINGYHFTSRPSLNSRGTELHKLCAFVHTKTKTYRLCFLVRLKEPLNKSILCILLLSHL